jgi:energy-coupling factor transporter ATP-binding protein EcfA2
MMSENQDKVRDELAKIEQAIAAQEALRGVMPDEQIEAMVASLQQQRALTLAKLAGSGAIAQDGSVAVGEGLGVGGDVHGGIIDGDDNIQADGHVVIIGEGASGTTVVFGEMPVKMTAVERKSALGRYLQHVISRNCYLQLQGISSRGKLVHIELDRIYITLRATQQRLVEQEEEWLAAEAKLAPGEARRMRGEGHLTTETTTVSVNEALERHHRLVVLGDPGSGKTTLLRYLALLYARDLAEGGQLVEDKLGLEESGWLPLLFPLRQIGAFIDAHHGLKDGTEGHRWLLDYICQVLENERIDVLEDFFDEWLTQGKAVILLDGLDEVADPDLRRRVSRLVEAFTRAYPACRYVVTSRIVGYTGAARLGEDYATTAVRDFNMADVEQFLQNWHRLIAIGQMGPGASAEAYAREQTSQLKQAIEVNERIRELAINPLMLTVIAMVHRDRVKLPDRRAELYAEAVDVLLGKWEEAKGISEIAILEGEPFDWRQAADAAKYRLEYARSGTKGSVGGDVEELVGGDVLRHSGRLASRGSGCGTFYPGHRGTNGLAGGARRGRLRLLAPDLSGIPCGVGRGCQG